MCRPMNDLWFEIVVHSVHYTLGNSLLRELLAFVFSYPRGFGLTFKTTVGGIQ